MDHERHPHDGNFVQMFGPSFLLQHQPDDHQNQSNTIPIKINPEYLCSNFVRCGFVTIKKHIQVLIFTVLSWRSWTVSDAHHILVTSFRHERFRSIERFVLERWLFPLFFFAVWVSDASDVLLIWIVCIETSKSFMKCVGSCRSWRSFRQMFVSFVIYNCPLDWVQKTPSIDASQMAGGYATVTIIVRVSKLKCARTPRTRCLDWSIASSVKSLNTNISVRQLFFFEARRFRKFRRCIEPLVQTFVFLMFNSFTTRRRAAVSSSKNVGTLVNRTHRERAFTKLEIPNKPSTHPSTLKKTRDPVALESCLKARRYFHRRSTQRHWFFDSSRMNLSRSLGRHPQSLSSWKFQRFFK